MPLLLENVYQKLIIKIVYFNKHKKIDVNMNENKIKIIKILLFFQEIASLCTAVCLFQLKKKYVHQFSVND